MDDHNFVPLLEMGKRPGQNPTKDLGGLEKKSLKYRFLRDGKSKDIFMPTKMA